MDDFASYYPMYKLSPQKVKLIERCINTFKPIQILEIGTFFGYSALHIAKAMTDNSKLTCIEANPQNADIAKKILNYAFYNQPNILKRVNIITGISTNVLNSNIMNEVVFKNHTTPVLFDFVFLDHDKNSYLPDLIRLEELSLISNQKCLLVADNVLYPGAPEYLNYLNRNNSISPNFRWKTTYEYFPFERVGFETNFKEVKDAMSISTNIMN
jgi:predicted O-methyltransferase YrrM